MTQCLIRRQSQVAKNMDSIINKPCHSTIIPHVVKPRDNK